MNTRLAALCILAATAYTSFHVAAQIHDLHYWDHWQLGDQVSVNFPNGLAGIAQSDVGMANRETTRITICDPVTGDILFSFAGDSIRGADNLVVPNGGPGGFTEWSGWIADPGDAKVYYLFKNSFGLASGWHVAIVRRDTGILLGEGYIALGPYASHVALAAISDPEGFTTWAVTHDMQSDAFRFYRVGAPLGLDTVASVQHIGPAVNNFFNGCFMRVSPDNTKLALANAGPNWATIFDVDPSIGVLSNPVQIPIPHDLHGAEFSSNSRFLYVWGGPPKITQLDLGAGDGAAILASAITLPLDSTRFAQLPRLGTDGRIYIGTGVGFGPADRYARILDPDQPGLACNTDTVGLMFPNPSHGPLVWNYWPFTPSYMSTPEYHAAANNVRAWPVPATDQVSIDPGTELDKATVSWMDAAGRIVRTDAWPAHTRTATFDRGALRAGSYIVEVRSAESVPLRAKVILE